jgi:hypothetical protein
MVAEELGYVYTEDLETKWLQKNLGQNGCRRTWIRVYRSPWNKMVTEKRGKMVAEELRYVDTEYLGKKMVTEELRIQWLQVLDQNGYRTARKWLQKNLEYNDKRIS